MSGGGSPSATRDSARTTPAAVPDDLVLVCNAGSSSLRASLGGLDALVFTAGVGENSGEIRRRACAGLEHLGLRLDEAANAETRPDVDIASSDSPARIFVVASREDLTIVRELRPLVRTPGGDR